MDARSKIVSPVGESAVRTTSMAPALDTLEGKTIGMIWNAGFMGETVFPIIEEMLRERYPGVKISPYSEFPLTRIAAFGPELKAKTLEAVRVALAEKGCDAVITGNAG